MTWWSILQDRRAGSLPCGCHGPGCKAETRLPAGVKSQGYRLTGGKSNLNDLNFVMIAYTPGNMGAGNWTTAVYIDEKADGEQREALSRILSGDVGGPAQRWMPLTTDFKGTKYCSITYTAEGQTRSVAIPEIMDFAVEGIAASGWKTWGIR